MAVYTTVETPIGELVLTGTGSALSSVSMTGAVPAGAVRDDAALAGAAGQIGEYFAGTRTSFELEFEVSGSEFQRRVWDAMDAIPYGTTTSYGALTAALGLPRERAQAVGAALGANPLLLVRPCHRVVGADGSLRGYAGGLHRKERLLIHEGALQPTLI